jgi:hypothetical protein
VLYLGPLVICNYQCKAEKNKIIGGDDDDDDDDVLY